MVKEISKDKFITFCRFQYTVNVKLMSEKLKIYRSLQNLTLGFQE